ncbi:hypothetical protein QA640_04540 [Bradyrhizobium sp. CB82]|nr:hypothetical protein [Bradyrhizobium sp. CB82]WFU41786.1 hypothetical protein QA640_04540 [Bradyrhizobium sp. CB82]
MNLEVDTNCRRKPAALAGELVEIFGGDLQGVASVQEGKSR